MLRYGGLFEGIGGFALAAKLCDFDLVWSNEIDDFCCKVLRKNFSHQIIQDDIKRIGVGRDYDLQPVDIICGGFPCQPYSLAGKRHGNKDSRHLWPEMLRVVTELRPRWIVGENVAGIFSMAQSIREFKMEDQEITFEESVPLLTKIGQDLEEIGYRSLFFNIPACAASAPHERKRIWIVSHSDQEGLEIGEGFFDDSLQEQPPSFRTNWQTWMEAASKLCGVYDGVSTKLDKRGTSDRRNRIMALGNAVVPQIPHLIFKAIQKIENEAR